MGGRSYMVATRMPMSREGFDEWLRTPLPDLGVIENPSAMYAGWAGEGIDPDWELTSLADHPAAVTSIRAQREKTPQQLLAARAARGFTLARHHGDALEVHLYDYHGDAHGTRTDLLMPAGAGRFAHAGAETPVMYWGGDVHPGLPMGGDPPLAVLLVGNARARFADSHPIDALIADLRPVETDFLAAVSVADDTEDIGWDPSGVLDSALRP